MNILENKLKEIVRAERELLLSELRSIVSSRRPNEDRKLTAKEAAAFLGISLSTLYKNVKFLPHRKFGKKLVFIMRELHELDFASVYEKKEKQLSSGDEDDLLTQRS